MSVYIVMLPYDDGPPIAAFQSRANAEAFAEAHFQKAIERAKQSDPNDYLSPAYEVKHGKTWEEACWLHEAFVEELEVRP